MLPVIKSVFCLYHLGGGFLRWKKSFVFFTPTHPPTASCASEATYAPHIYLTGNSWIMRHFTPPTSPPTVWPLTPHPRHTSHTVQTQTHTQQVVLSTRGQRHLGPSSRDSKDLAVPGDLQPFLVARLRAQRLHQKPFGQPRAPPREPLQTREAEGSPEDLELPSSLLLLKPCSRAKSGPAPAKKLGPVDVEKLWSVTSSWARPYTGGSPRANDLGALWLRAHGRPLINAES